MAFDFNRPLRDDDGEIDEEAFREYAEDLMRLFAESPEIREHISPGSEIGWASTMMDFGSGYLGVTPATTTESDFGEVLFDLFPRKMSCEPSFAPEIVRELRAFWTFLGREFGAPHAAACLKLLDGDAAKRLEEALGDPSKYGMAKGFFMAGKKLGFNVTTEKGMNEWMLAHNAAMAANRLGIGTDAAASPLPPFASERPHGASSSAKRKMRKAQRAARKRNR